jgi:hypothetical protein
LIEALRVKGLGEWARLHIEHELTHRSPTLVEEVAGALVAQPIGPGAAALGEVLVQHLQYHLAPRERVVRALIDAGGAALDAGANSREAGVFLVQLGECATLTGALPEASALARRLLDLAATEASPYGFAIAAARRLEG